MEPADHLQPTPNIDEFSVTPPDGEAMTEESTNASGAVFVHSDGRHSEIAAAIARGTLRHLAMLNFACVMELTLRNGRRADIAAIGPNGEIWIVEVKSCVADFKADAKWPDYLDHCDRFFFAVDGNFPTELLPEDAGLIIADRYGGEIIRESPEQRLAAARRKQVTLALARAGAQRLHSLLDPDFSIER